MRLFYAALLVTASIAQAADSSNTLRATLMRFDDPDTSVRETALAEWESQFANSTRPGDKASTETRSKELVTAIADATEPQLIRILRQLALCATPAVAADVAPLLQHESFAVRDQARQTLELIPGRAIDEYLLSALRQTSDARQVAGLLNALAARGTVNAVPEVETRLDHADPIIATAARQALRKTATADAIRVLTTRFTKATPDQRVERGLDLIAAAGHIADRDPTLAAKSFDVVLSDGESKLRVAALAGLLQANPTRIKKELTSALDRVDAEALAVLFAATERTRDPGYALQISKNLGPLPDDVKVSALAAIGSARTPATAPFVAALLSSTNSRVAIAAIQALSRCGKSDSLPPLLLAAERYPKEVLLTLEEMNAKGLDEELVGVLNGTTDQRGLALDALLARGSAAVDALLPALATDTVERISIAAWQALGNRAHPDRLDQLLTSAKQLRSRAPSDAAIAALNVLSQRSPDPIAAQDRIASQISDAPVDLQKAWLASAVRQASEGASIPDSDTRLALTLLQQKPVAPAAAHFLTAYAPRWLLLDPAAAADALAVIAAADLPADVKQRAASINGLQDGWLLDGMTCGPFTHPQLMDHPFAPEQTGASVDWKALDPSHRTGDQSRILDLARTYPGYQRAAYLRFTFIASADEARVLELGSDDGLVVWLNGNQVHRKDVVRPCLPGEDRVAIQVRKGRNDLLVKVVQREGNFQFCGRVIASTMPSAAPR